MQIGQAHCQYIRWLMVTRDLSPHTIRAYDGDLAALERHLGANAPVVQIDREQLISFIEDQRERGLCPASIKRRVSGLRGFYQWLHSRGFLEDDPWRGMSLAGGRTRKLPRTVPSPELDRLLLFLWKAAGADGPLSAEVLRRPHESTTLLAVALMVTTGVRVNEAVGIRCQDIDLSGRSLRLMGKGRRERQVFLTNEWIVDLTGAYLKARSALAIDHSRLLFNVRGEPLSTAAMRSRLAKAAQAAGVGRRVTPHMLRHTAATQLIEAGVDIRYIQRLLGHASLSTTEIYTHVSDRALKRVVSDADVLGRVMQTR